MMWWITQITLLCYSYQLQATSVIILVFIIVTSVLVIIILYSNIHKKLGALLIYTYQPLRNSTVIFVFYYDFSPGKYIMLNVNHLPAIVYIYILALYFTMFFKFILESIEATFSLLLNTMTTISSLYFQKSKLIVYNAQLYIEWTLTWTVHYVLIIMQFYKL